MLDGGDGERPSDTPLVVTVGQDLAAGQVPQHVIPAGHWQAARPAAASEVLVSCVVAPGFDFADFTLLPA
jgi:predicted cupin superfamily sugar epimerase